MSIINDTLAMFREKAQISDSCIVAYSGGKDSLVVMDMCVKSFKTVVPFFMYFIPDLDCINQQLAYCKTKWGLDVMMYPHWLLFKCLKSGAFCDEHFSKDDMPEPSLLDIYSWVRAETGIHWLATGAKKSDSIWRRRCYFASTKHWDWAVYPLKEWNKFDVFSYLEANDIPVPDSSGKSATGVDLSTPSLLWLHDKHPNDYQKLLRYFPYAEAVIKRREFYGIE